MKKTLLLALLAFVALPLTALADEPVTERKIHLKIVADAELLDLDLSNLEVGESQQLYTESGKEVVVTRTDETYEIQVEGRDEPIIVRSGHHAYAYGVDHECGEGEDCVHDVMIRKLVVDGDTEDAHSLVFINKDGELHELGEGEGHHWVGAAAGEGHGMHVMRFAAGEGAVERLLASGALDGLDEAKRQEILDALRADAEHMKMKVKVIEKHRHDDE